MEVTVEDYQVVKDWQWGQDNDSFRMHLSPDTIYVISMKNEGEPTSLILSSAPVLK